MNNNVMKVLLALMVGLTLLVIVMSYLAINEVNNIVMPNTLPPSADSLNAATIFRSHNEVGKKKSEMVMRPLFWQERRPYVATTKKISKKKLVTATKEEDPFEKVKLIGVYSGGAMFNLEGKKQRFYVGDEVAEWALSVVDFDSVVFEKGGDTRLLQLEHARVKAVRKPKPKKPSNLVNKSSEKNAISSDEIGDEKLENTQPNSGLKPTTVKNNEKGQVVK